MKLVEAGNWRVGLVINSYHYVIKDRVIIEELGSKTVQTSCKKHCIRQDRHFDLLINSRRHVNDVIVSVSQSHGGVLVQLNDECLTVFIDKDIKTDDVEEILGSLTLKVLVHLVLRKI